MQALPDGCLVGVVEEPQRRIFVVRGPDGRTYPSTGRHTRRADRARRRHRRSPSASPAATTWRCWPRPPVFGQPGLLPPELPWAYVYDDPRPASGRASRRLVVTDVRAPDDFELPRLAPQPTVATRPGEEVVALVGWEATPSRVLAEMPLAHAIDLHVHGVLLPHVSDVPALVLSADARARRC